MVRKFLDAYESLVADGGGGGAEIPVVTTVTETINGPVATVATVAPEVLPAAPIPNVLPVVDIPVSTPVLIQNQADVIPENTPVVVQNKPEVLPYNLVSLLKGFGAYVSDILPDDVATSCGAFSTAMQQIRNIQSVPIEKFAQVVTNLETTRGLDLVAGTDVPTNLTLASDGANLVALGSGPNGTYTDSDFFGAMSGLPYPWKDIQTNIGLLQTSTLANIYTQLYLAVTWAQPGVITATYSDDGFGNYILTNVSLPTNRGGGYGREGTSAPVVTVAGGNVTLSIGTNSNDISTFGKITSLSWTAVGTTGSPTTSVSIPDPTTIYGSANWSPGMNNAVQYYIDAANTEITNIYNGNVNAGKKLNLLWKMVGTQLRVEQQARVTALPPVPVPQDIYLSQFPTSTMAFVDSIPQFALNTLPHMYSQTLEAISNWKTTGGQSMVGMMRQERNQVRLLQAGIELDNNMAGESTSKTTKLLGANGTVSVANEGAGIQIDDATFTIPATLSQINNSNEIGIPSPIGYYDNERDAIVVPERFVNSDVLGTLSSLENVPQIVQPGDDEAGFEPIITLATGNVQAALNNVILGPNGQNPNLINPVAGTGKVPSGVATPLDTGKPNTTGSLAGSRYQNVIPAPLQVAFTASALTPSTYNVKEAIDEVINCNCDCWIN